MLLSPQGQVAPGNRRRRVEPIVQRVGGQQFVARTVTDDRRRSLTPDDVDAVRDPDRGGVNAEEAS
jgi:hypothetical protein